MSFGTTLLCFDTIRIKKFVLWKIRSDFNSHPNFIDEQKPRKLFSSPVFYGNLAYQSSEPLRILQIFLFLNYVFKSMLVLGRHKGRFNQI